jgi:hypothetical protein
LLEKLINAIRNIEDLVKKMAREYAEHDLSGDIENVENEAYAGPVVVYESLGLHDFAEQIKKDPELKECIILNVRSNLLNFDIDALAHAYWMSVMERIKKRKKPVESVEELRDIFNRVAETSKRVDEKADQVLSRILTKTFTYCKRKKRKKL